MSLIYVQLIVWDVPERLLRMDPIVAVENCYDYKAFLLLTELEVDQEMIRRGLRLGIPYNNNNGLLRLQCLKGLF